MRCLVTGGSGFLGSHLCTWLIRQGYDVVCLDNLSTGNLKNIRHLSVNRRFQFVERDIVQKFDYRADRIYNLACPASPLHYQKNPVATINTIAQGIYNCIDNAIKYGARILQASTSEVYGNPLAHPQSERYWGNVNPTGPRACYNEAKRFAETVLVNYQTQFNTEIRIARIFNTYGLNMQLNDGRVVTKFIVQALKNESLTVYGDGRQTRSFCFVDDMISGLLALMEHDSYNRPINIGNTEEISMLELAEMIIRLTDSRSRIAFEPLPMEDPQKRRPDITLARETLGWEPQIDLVDGLKETIAYMKNVLTA